VVGEALQRARLDAGPRPRERREQIVPADLPIVDHVHAGRLHLADRRARDLVVHLVEVGVADLAAVATMERATQLLPVEAFTDLWIRTDHSRLQGHAGTLASRLGRSPADSTTRPTPSGHAIENSGTP